MSFLGSSVSPSYKPLAKMIIDSIVESQSFDSLSRIQLSQLLGNQDVDLTRSDRTFFLKIG